MAKIFESAQVEKPKMSAFDLSREQKLSCDMAELVPTYLEEIVPGDQFRVQSDILVRFAPMIAPIMHKVDVFMHYFFVPNRLVWSEWEDFITGGQDGTTEPVFPTLDMQGPTMRGSELADYMGIPNFSTDNSNLKVSALPFRAYQLIFHEYYRDPNLRNEFDVETMADGSHLQLRIRAWEKDYFTSALPWTQRNTAGVVEIPVSYNDISSVYDSAGNEDVGNLLATTSGDGNLNIDTDGDGVGDKAARIENVSGVDVNELRRSTALQRWLEKSARGGYRYIETILAQFGERVEDWRLQRPEYLGGGKQTVQISEVLNTSATSTEPQGHMSGHGISYGETMSFQYQAKEHGYIIGILSVMPKTAYQQGIDRHWTRTDKFDFYWPELAHLGEQEIKNYEVYFDSDDDNYNNDTFGYQQRWAEYKYGKSSVHADFRDSLDHWHLGRIFASQPNLNQSFVEANPASDRVFAAPENDNIWVSIFHSVKARRPMPYFSDPRL